MVSKIVVQVGSSNSLAPVRLQAFTWTSADLWPEYA